MLYLKIFAFLTVSIWPPTSWWSAVPVAPWENFCQCLFIIFSYVTFYFYMKNNVEEFGMHEFRNLHLHTCPWFSIEKNIKVNIRFFLIFHPLSTLNPFKGLNNVKYPWHYYMSLFGCAKPRSKCYRLFLIDWWEAAKGNWTNSTFEIKEILRKIRF